MQNNTYKQTPVGKGNYVYILTPDTGNATFQIPPTYKVDLELLPERAETVIKDIRSFRDALVEEKRKTSDGKEIKVADLPYKQLDNGNYSFSFKMKQNGVVRATGKSFTQQPNIVDNKGKAWDKSIPIYSGSTMRINYQLVPYENTMNGVGVSLRLKDVQIVDLVNGGGGNPFTNTSVNSDGSVLPGGGTQ